MFCHIDADCFFVSVLRRKYPRLQGKPIIALGMGGGCVIAASYEAKAKGVKTGMRFKDAKKLCPEAISLPSDFAETHTASKQIHSILTNECSVIERTSIDEWYVDLRGNAGGIPKDFYIWAHGMQKIIKERTAIPVSIGIAPTKLLAKMASPYKKPFGIAIISNAKSKTDNVIDRETFLRSLSAYAIPGIGRQRGMHAAAQGWKKAHDIAIADKNTIVHLFGKPGLEMQQELNGMPIHKVIIDAGPPKSISRCRSFRAIRGEEHIHAHVLQHLSYCTFKMRHKHLAATSVGIWLRDGDYKQYGYDMKLPQPSNTEEQLLPYVERCFHRVLEKTASYTQTGIVLAGLVPDGTMQYSLFEESGETEKAETMQKTLDALRAQFGRDAIVRAPSITLGKYDRSIPSVESQRM